MGSRLENQCLETGDGQISIAHCLASFHVTLVIDKGGMQEDLDVWREPSLLAMTPRSLV